MRIVLHPNARHDGELVLCRPSEFPYLHTLHLTTFSSISSSNIRALSRIFPYLVKFTFAVRDHHGVAGHIRGMLVLMQEDQGLHHDVSVWPRLLTLGIHISGREPFPMNERRSFLVAWATIGLPIRTLLLPPAFISKGRKLSSCAVSPMTIEELILSQNPLSDDLSGIS